jgi:hypothetical protein
VGVVGITLIAWRQAIHHIAITPIMNFAHAF